MIIALQTLVFFRETLLAALERAIAPYYKRIILAFSSQEGSLKDEEPDEQVFSEFDDEKGVVFFPPMYVQRYAAVSDCLMDERWRGKLEKVVDFGYHDVSFIKYLKDVPGIKHILGVDIESLYLTCFPDLFCCDEYNTTKRERPLQITLFQGNAADPDYRLIGCDAVIAIEMIEHMLPHDLDRLVHTVFGFIKPWIAIFTTPNSDFNVLFKSLEKNGYRRLDHFFEWTREQFNDWCSNIIVRYPLYTVGCQGVGPGPPGTNHHGCCSQLALFINTDYVKQPDCNIDSLALVSNAPTPKPLTELVDGWENIDNMEHFTQTSEVPDLSIKSLECIMDCPYTDDPLCMPLILSPKVSNIISHPLLPTHVESETTVVEEEYISKSDKMSQCDLDVEFGKNFLMFDECQCLDIRVPRRRKNNRVYEIGDVASRLNCSTFRIQSFSKTTQNLLARNKMDMLGRTRAVVDEICHLTKTLKINKSEADRQEEGATTWYNINWGENAPYWNQFYRIVGEYNYPSEAKSDDCRILDLLTDEINRMIDTHFEDVPCNVTRLEIPMSHLMSVVRHLTDDVDMVRDLLEWNGYEIEDDVVIHSRFVIGSASVATHDEDSQDIETNFSDWDNITEVRSTTFSEGSTIVPDYHDRCLRRALDHKVRNLRTMLTADEHISMELDKVICRLMRLALRTSKGCSHPPSLKWIQCKLLDLLTLTEKAIEHRKKHLIENSWKAIEFGNIHNVKIMNYTQDDYITKRLVNKYQHIILPDADTSKSALESPQAEDAMSVTSTEFIKELEYGGSVSPHENIPSEFIPHKVFEPVYLETELNSIEKTKAWLNVEVTDDNQDVTYVNSSEDTDSVSNLGKIQNKSKDAIDSNKELEATTQMTSSSKTSSIQFKLKLQEKKRQTSTTRVTKKVSRNSTKICGHYSNKLSPFNNQGYMVKSKRISKENRCVTMRASKPIPESLINLCHPELKVEKCIKKCSGLSDVDAANKIVISYQPSPKASNEDNMLNSIIMDDTQMYDSQDNTNLHRSIGTDAEEVGNISRKDYLGVLEKGMDLNICSRHEVSTENICAQTIFLNDINEPSTSKGIRHHVSTDVQCGPDTLAAYPMLSAATSLVRMSPVFPGIKIHDGTTETTTQSKDFGTTTQDNDNDVIMTPRSRSIGIKIKDSDVNICTTDEEYTLSKNFAKSGNETPNLRYSSPPPSSLVPRSWSPESSGRISDNKVFYGTNTIESSTKTDYLPVSCTKTEDSGSEFSESRCSFQKIYPHVDSPKMDSELLPSNPHKHKNNTSVASSSNSKFKKPKLGYGGIDVHSYKDKQESIDIVYQGEWQRYKLKTLRKKTHSYISLKKYNDSSNKRLKDTVKVKKIKSKEIADEKKQLKESLELQTATHTQQNSTCKKKRSWHSKIAIYNKSSLKTRPSVNVAKVPSKTAVCSSKNVKSAFTAKKPQIKTNIVVKEGDNTKTVRKSYIPPYLLKRKKQISAEHLKKKELKSDMSSLREQKKEIKKDLLKFHDNVYNKTFMVFHNKNQENCSSRDKQQIPNVTTNEAEAKQDESFMKRARSPPSLNSSTCSSLNSIATVRAVTTKSKNLTIKRHSASSYKNSLNISGSENTTPTKTKKSFVKSKNAKKSDNNKDTTKKSDNKENIPATTTNLAKKETEKLLKSPFVGKHKSVCIAQLKTDRSLIQTTTTNLSKHKSSNKSIIKLPKSDDAVELSMSPTRKRSQKSENYSINNNKSSNPDMSHNNLQSDNMVLELTPQEPTTLLPESENIPQQQQPTTLLPESENIPQQQQQQTTGSIANTINNNLVTGWIEKLQCDSQTTNCTNYVRHIIDDMLTFVDPGPMAEDHVDTSNLTDDLNESVCSFKTTTATDNLNNTFAESDLESSLDYLRTYESILQDEESGINMTVTDLDLLSFKSITSNSKHSEYYLSNSVLNTAIASIESTPSHPPVRNPPSVTDIFERKETHVVQKQPGFLANQAFSGFTLDGEPVSGDQPDPVALIDSETGSVAMAMGRQATSEELFVSGRSTDSYESCVIDEDSVVPNWLFQIISQQQSVAESQPLISQPLPLMVEPRYDVNGNSVEPGIVGVDAGAGDGCGIHSDQSQDSSGRGTSLSSSETSSSQVSQSEDLAIDQLGFTGQFDMVRNSTATSDTWSADTREASPGEDRLRLTDELEPIPVTGHSRRRPRTQFNVVSGVDADISSIDTDVPDSSDNN